MKSFNPLDRGKLYLMSGGLIDHAPHYHRARFNPLDRGKLYLIEGNIVTFEKEIRFQSPRSGKIVSNSTSTQTLLSGEQSLVSIP